MLHKKVIIDINCPQWRKLNSYNNVNTKALVDYADCFGITLSKWKAVKVEYCEFHHLL